MFWRAEQWVEGRDRAREPNVRFLEARQRRFMARVIRFAATGSCRLRP